MLSFSFAPEVLADEPFNPEIKVYENYGQSTQTEPSIAVDANGTAYIVWLEENSIMFSKTTDAGIFFSHPITLGNSTAMNPSIVVVNNNVYVIWSTVDNIYFAKSENGGLSFISKSLIYNNTGQFLSPSITADIKGNIYVAWEKTLGGPISYVYFTRSTDNGITFTEPFKISGYSAVRMRPSITCDILGNVFLTWIEGDNLGYSLRFSMSKNEGISFESIRIISQNVDGADDYIGEITRVDRAIAVSPHGSIYVVWGNNGIFINQSTDSGLSFSSGTKINDAGTTGASPSVVVDIEGNVHVAWIGNVNGTSAVYYDVSTDDGETFTTDIKLNSGTAPISYEPSLGVAGNGGIYAVWQARRLGTGSEIFDEVYFSTTNDPIFPVTLNSPLEVTADSMNLTWSQNTNLNFDKYELHMATHVEFAIDSSTLVACYTDETATDYTVIGLAEDTTYYFKVRVYCSGGLYTDSNEVSGRTVDEILIPVVLNVPTGITNSSMILTWSRNANTNFVRYELHMSEDANLDISPSTLVATITDQDSTTYNVTGLAEDEIYYFRVRVFDVGESYADSNEVSGKTLENGSTASIQNDFISMVSDNYLVVILVLLIIITTMIAAVKRQWIIDHFRRDKGRNVHERNKSKN